MPAASGLISRILASVIVASFVGVATAAAKSGTEVGFVSSLRGKPQVRDTTGKTWPVGLMDSLSPGARIILRPGDSVGFCHESTSRTYRIEGIGEVYVGDVGINVEPGGPSVTTVGACNSTSTPSETGGVLLRGMDPPQSSR